MMQLMKHTFGILVAILCFSFIATAQDAGDQATDEEKQDGITNMKEFVEIQQSDEPMDLSNRQVVVLSDLTQEEIETMLEEEDMSDKKRAVLSQRLAELKGVKAGNSTQPRQEVETKQTEHGLQIRKVDPQ